MNREGAGRRWPEIVFVVAGWIGLIIAGHPSAAVAQFFTFRCETGGPTGDPRFNPCPDPRDVVLPMPGGIYKMVFRTERIPDNGYWGQVTRQVQVGNLEARAFEDRQQVVLGGTQPLGQNPSGAWVIHFGKYEVTKGQFIAVLGEGDEAAGLDTYRTLSLDTDAEPLFKATMSERERQQQLSRPVSNISWFAVQEFLQKYNIWCLEDNNCRRILHDLGFEGAFIRLPTEVEWEYIARGGYPAVMRQLQAPGFSDPLPFDSQEAVQYEQISEQQDTRIGRFRPLRSDNPVYDMFGNVSEMMAGQFFSELTQGKVGAVPVRGGNFMNSPENLRSSMRSELPFFYVTSRGDVRQGGNRTIGFRLAIGSIAMPGNITTRSSIEEEHHNYFQSYRSAVAPGLSVQTPLVAAREPAARIREMAEQLKGVGGVANYGARILEEISLVERKLHEEAIQSGVRTAYEAISYSTSIAQDTLRMQQIKEAINVLSMHMSADIRRQEDINNFKRQLREHESTRSNWYNKYKRAVLFAARYEDFKSEILSRVNERITPNMDKVTREAHRLFEKNLNEIISGASTNYWLQEMNDVYSSMRLWRQQ